MRLILVIFSTGILFSLAANANVVGPAWQNFNTTTDGLDYVTVQSSKTLTPGLINLGVFTNLAVNTLPYLDSTTQSRIHLNDELLGLDLNAGIGITNRWDAGLSLPMMLYQHISDDADVHGQFLNYGLTEVRANTKYRLLGDDDGGVAAVGSVNFNAIVNDPYQGNGGGPTFNLELVADKTINHISFAVNAGRRFRHPGTPIAGAPVEPLTDQWIFSGATSYLLTSIDTKLIGEIFGSTPVGSGSNNLTRSLTSAEALVGLKHDYSTSLSVHVGGGTGLDRGTSSPDWRVYAGLNYTFGPVFKSSSSVGSLESVPESGNNERFRTSSVLFDFNSDQLNPKLTGDLAGLVEHLKSSQFKKLVIEGHTDSVGNHNYNVDLSLRRAKHVREYLVSQGIAASKIEVQGYGPDRPIADNGNFQGRQKNRRVEFLIQH